MLRHISPHSHIRDMIHWYETPGTRAVAEIVEANYDYSEMQVRLDISTVGGVLTFSCNLQNK